MQSDSCRIPHNKADLVGQRFGRLVVESYQGTNKHQKSLWRAFCDCGGETIVITGCLRNGSSRSCGCLHREQSAKNILSKGVTWREDGHHRWKGGVGSDRHLAMGRKEYKEWREAVFTRDQYICQQCFQRGGNLQAHHIKSWEEHPELRYAVSNGATLCHQCHLTRH